MSISNRTLIIYNWPLWSPPASLSRCWSSLTIPVRQLSVHRIWSLGKSSLNVGLYTVPYFASTSIERSLFKRCFIYRILEAGLLIPKEGGGRSSIYILHGNSKLIFLCLILYRKKTPLFISNSLQEFYFVIQ